MQKTLNLKIIYGSIYGVLSLVVGGLFLFHYFSYKLGAFWLRILLVNGRGGVSGAWLMACVISYFIFIVCACRVGMKRGIFIEHGNQKDKSKLMFYVSLLLVFMFGFLITHTVIEQDQVYKKLVASLPRVEAIVLNQKENSLLTKVAVRGVGVGVYELQLVYKANSFVVKELKSIRRIVPLKYNVQFFDDVLSFDRLSQLYREALNEYVPSFQRTYQFEEYIDIIATLRLKQHQEFSSMTLRRLQLAESEEIVSSRFRFSCQEDGCQVVQDGAPEK